MAYSTRYLFKFDSVVNGIAYEIHIMEDGYAGGITQRSLGASPTLRRDNSGHVAGTSLEFLAECVVDGEFSILYTPDPFRFKVVLYQNDVAIWSGFVSPELYAEPDIAPPYDVNITAVDGLGELKKSIYQAQGATTIGRIITYLLSHTGLSLSVSQINSVVGGGTPIMDVVVDLDNMVGESCYDVLQSLLETMNAIITQRGNTWLIARENDMSAVDGGVTFGSMDDCAWWPVGQMRSEIIPAKRKVVVTAENSYKEILKNSDMSYDGEWEKGYTTIFDTQENAYLVGLYSISQTVNFAEPLAASLVLRVKARAKDADNQNGSLRFRIGMEGYVQGNAKGSYRLLPSQTNPDVLTWRSANSTAFFDKPLSPSQYTNSEKDATEIEIVLPFFRAVDRDFKTTCDSLTIDIYGGDAEDFYIYEASLQVEYQTKGVQDVLRINNGAREDAKEVGIAFYAGNIPNGLYGTPTGASGTIISQWSTNDFANLDYLAFIARDYAKGVALPRMNKSGKLNVGTSVGMPLLFMDSEGVAYFPKTLSWDLYNDEMDVNLVSLPNAIIEVESESVGEITGGTSPGSSTGSVGGGGVSGATTLDGLRDVTITEPKEGDTLMRIGKEWVNTPAIWSLDENGNLVTDKQVIIKNNLIVEGDTASGGEAGSVPVGITGILLNGTTYRDDNSDGVIDLGTITSGLTSVNWSDVQGRPTALSQFNNDLGLGTLAYKNGLTASDVGALSTAGGTINGTTTGPLVVNTTNATEVGIPLAINSSKKVWFGYSTAVGGAYMYNAVAKRYMGILDDGSAFLGGNTILHSGNIGSYKAGSATKLATARTIWGQSFDGTGNVSGHLYLGTGTILSSKSGTDRVFLDFGSAGDPYIGYGTASAGIDSHLCGNNIYLHYGTSRTNGLILNSSGNVLIGTTTDAGYKLNVNGDVGISSTNGSIEIDNGRVIGNATLTMQAIGTTHARIQTSHFGVAYTCPLYINPSGGNVLIGTTTDAGYKLDVNGSAAFGSTSDCHIVLRRSGGLNYIDAAGSLRLTVNGGSNALTINTDMSTYMYGAVTMDSTLSVGGNTTINGDVRINGNLIVTGDTASGGSAGTTYGVQLLTLNDDIPTGTSVAQSALDAIGLTSQVIDDLIDGKYHHMALHVNSWSGLFTISGDRSSSSRSLFFHYGAEQADTSITYFLHQYNGGNWEIIYREM